MRTAPCQDKGHPDLKVSSFQVKKSVLNEDFIVAQCGCFIYSLGKLQKGQMLAYWRWLLPTVAASLLS
jgi:hypothetical protein